MYVCAANVLWLCDFVMFIFINQYTSVIIIIIIIVVVVIVIIIISIIIIIIIIIIISTDFPRE